MYPLQLNYSAKNNKEIKNDYAFSNLNFELLTFFSILIELEKSDMFS